MTAGEEGGATGTAVILHVYDVTNIAVTKYLNKVFRDVGGVGGAFHGAVEVYGEEWSFGHTPGDDTGVFVCEPKQCIMHRYKESIPMGESTLSEAEVKALIKRLEAEWLGKTYDLLSRNCCTFSDTLCQELGVGPIPVWVNRFAGVGSSARGMGSSAMGEANRAMEKSGIRGKAEKVRGFLSGMASKHLAPKKPREAPQTQTCSTEQKVQVTE